MFGTYAISDVVRPGLEVSSHVNGFVTQEENAQNPEEPEEITHPGDKTEGEGRHDTRAGMAESKLKARPSGWLKADNRCGWGLSLIVSA
jgi:hypothetical protein